MPWCPKCRNEYRAGFTVCADCGVELVDVLGEETVTMVPVFTVPSEEMSNIIEFLNSSELKGFESRDNGDGSSDLLVEEKHRKEVMFALRTFLEKRKEEYETLQAKNMIPKQRVLSEEDETEPAKETEEKPLKVTSTKDALKPSKAPYQSSKAKADDAKNSALALLIIGVIGIVFEALVVFHVLPLTINGITGKVLYAFMAAVFLLLIIAGIRSLFTARRLREAIVDEGNVTEDILKFVKEELKEKVEKLIPDNGGGDETSYFARMDFMKSAIHSEPKFKDISMDTLDGILDENYHEIFS